VAKIPIALNEVEISPLLTELGAPPPLGEVRTMGRGRSLKPSGLETKVELMGAPLRA
jgi:hypothetical protein